MLQRLHCQPRQQNQHSCRWAEAATAQHTPACLRPTPGTPENPGSASIGVDQSQLPSLKDMMQRGPFARRTQADYYALPTGVKVGDACSAGWVRWAKAIALLTQIWVGAAGSPGIAASDSVKCAGAS